jgi:hypothetical protein
MQRVDGHKEDLVNKMYARRITHGANPPAPYFQSASDPLGRKCEVSCTTEFIRNEIAHYGRPVSGFSRGFDRGSPAFLPFNDQSIT